MFYADKIAHEVMAHDFLWGVTSQFKRSFVPNIDFAIFIYAKYRGICRVKQARVFVLLCVDRCSFVSYPDKSQDAALGVSPRSRVEGNLYNLGPFFRLKRKGKFLNLNSFKSSVDERLDRGAMLGGDQYFEHVLTQDLSLCVPQQSLCPIIPEIHDAIIVGPKNGHPHGFQDSEQRVLVNGWNWDVATTQDQPFHFALFVPHEHRTQENLNNGTRDGSEFTL
mmetsp:Transcript_23413/g.31998  ORF Transcript_23413/g.31998 Transcript_23413/m.31998 type:complete len:222 (-) Transcript_23413:688-1353(-)